jgi:hypothetical protein
MRAPVGIVLLALVTACKNDKVEAPAEVVEAAPKTLLACPEGAQEFGAMPPAAQELWCGVATPTGSVLRHGPSRTWYRDGRPETVGAYADNRRVGHWWYWHDDGTLVKEGDFSDGAESGHWMVYEADGSIQTEGPMRDGRRNGVWNVYDPATGSMQQGVYIAGEQDGEWTEFNAQGVAVRQRLYRRGRLVRISEP